MRLKFTSTVLAASLMLLGSSTVFAQQTINWDAEGPADWNDDNNWDDGTGQGFVPTADFLDSANIGNGGIAQISGNVPEVVGLSVNNGRLEVLSGGTAAAQEAGSTGTSGTLHIADGGTFQSASFSNGGRLEFGGNGAVLDVSGSFGNSGTFVKNLGNTVVPNVGGTVQLGGTLEVQLGGETPAFGDTFDLISGSSVSGNFSSIVQEAGSAPLDRGLQFQVVENNNTAQLTLGNALVATIDRETGNVSVSNVVGGPIDVKGYSIQSAGGLMDGANFSGLAAGGTEGWTEANPTANNIAELNLISSSTLAADDTSVSLGSAYNQELGVSPREEDVTFNYTTPSGQIVQGFVEYTGAANDLVLKVNPDTGEAAIQHLSAFIGPADVKGFSILSDSGALDAGGFTGLGEAGWEQANPTANALSELNLESSKVFSDGTVSPLGNIFDTAGSRDLVFEYATADGQVLVGTVEYGPIDEGNGGPGLVGDIDLDGTVGLSDFTLLKDAFGTSEGDPNFLAGADIDMDGSVGLSDFTLLKDNFGASAAVPEPSTWALAALGLLALAGGRRLRRR